MSAGWAGLLGIEPTIGRLFTEDEEQLGRAAQVTLLSHALWETRFGSDVDVIGRAIPYDAGTLTVVGVLGPGFHYPYAADMWVPWRWDASDGVSHDLNVVSRMSPGATLDAVDQDLDRIAHGLQETRPGTNANLFLNVESLRSDLIQDDGSVLLALLAAVAFLLLLACVNVTNLFVARFVGRQREVAIRVALGGAGSARSGASWSRPSCSSSREAAWDSDCHSGWAKSWVS